MKSRNQTIYSYLTSLQMEYVVADLRKKIATRTKDKSYYEKVLIHKKTKIEDIALRNDLPSIFTNEMELSEVRSYIYHKWGFPDFIYKNDQERIDIRCRDIYNYLAEKSEVKVLIEDSTKLGIIVSSKQYIDQLLSDDINEVAIEVHVKGESSSRFILVKHLSRIL